MAKSATIITDIFAIVILLIMFAHSVGIVNPVGQVLIKSQTYTTVTHYQMTETYTDMGQSYKSKVPIPAGYTLELYDLNYAGPESGKAYLVPCEVPDASPLQIGNFNFESMVGNNHISIRGPGWMVIKATPAGYEIIDYKEGSGSATLINARDSKMPFESTLSGLGKALSEVTTNIYSEGY